MRSLSFTFVIALLVSPCVIAAPMHGAQHGNQAAATSSWPNVELQLRGLPESSLDAPVTHGVFAQCSNPATPHGGQEANHWRLFFAIAEDKSFSFDMVGADAPHGTLGVLGRPSYPVSTNGVLIIPMIPVTHLTVRSVLDLIEHHGLLRYRYAANGEGCRCWVSTVVHLLKDQGLIVSAGPNFPEFDNSIGCVWRHGENGPEGTPRPVEQGHFY